MVASKREGLLTSSKRVVASKGKRFVLKRGTTENGGMVQLRLEEKRGGFICDLKQCWGSGSISQRYGSGSGSGSFTCPITVLSGLE